MKNKVYKFTCPSKKITVRQQNLIKTMLAKMYSDKPQVQQQLLSKLPSMNVLAGHFAIRRLMSLQGIATL